MYFHYVPLVLIVRAQTSVKLGSLMFDSIYSQPVGDHDCQVGVVPTYSILRLVQHMFDWRGDRARQVDMLRYAAGPAASTFERRNTYDTQT